MRQSYPDLMFTFKAKSTHLKIDKQKNFILQEEKLRNFNILQYGFNMCIYIFFLNIKLLNIVRVTLHIIFI